MYVLSLLVWVVGVTTAFQYGWWKNQGRDSTSIVGGAHFNQIDFRYPNWVVNPRPPCVHEGVFPHPNSVDCTWYYRCVARSGIPRYATFYFQCEPGTMFDDDLDQCVHLNSSHNCQGTVTPELPTPQPGTCSPLQSTCWYYQDYFHGGSTVYLCRQEQCSLTGVKNYCSNGQLKDMETGGCADPHGRPECGGDYNSHSGIIRHPMIGPNYQNGDICIWTITSGEPINITFVSFDIENYHDVLEIRDGSGNESLVLGNYTGSSIPAPVEVNSGTAFIIFTTDDTVIDPGFVLEWDPLGEI